MEEIKPKELINRIRKDKGVTKKWLSKQVGVNNPTNIDSALSDNMKVPNMLRALDAFGMDVTIEYKGQKIKLV